MDFSFAVIVTNRLTKAGLHLEIIINILRREQHTWVVEPIRQRDEKPLPYIGVRLLIDGFVEVDYEKDFGGGKGPRKYHRFVRYNKTVTVGEVERALCESFGVDHLTHELCTRKRYGSDVVFTPVNSEELFWDQKRKPAKLCAYDEAYYIVHVSNVIHIYD